MPRPNTIDLLPSEIRDRIHAWLNDPSVTQLSAVDRTNALVDAINASRPEDEALPHVSKSGLNRYAQRVQQIGEKMRQSRQVAEMLIGQLGNAPAGEVGKLINESIRTIVFDAVTGLAESDEPVSPGVINKLALAAKRLEEATSINDKRERAIRDEERAAAAAAVETVGRGQGLTADTVSAIKAEILGI